MTVCTPITNGCVARFHVLLFDASTWPDFTESQHIYVGPYRPSVGNAPALEPHPLANSAALLSETWGSGYTASERSEFYYHWLHAAANHPYYRAQLEALRGKTLWVSEASDGALLAEAVNAL